MKGTKQVWIMMAVIFGLAVLLPSVATAAPYCHESTLSSLSPWELVEFA